MATIKNLTISDTGFVQLPSGATGLRGGAGETVVTFSSVGTTTWTCPAGVTNIRLLIVGGGGAGGWDVGAGGGGGGVIYYANYAVTPSTVYSVTVGGGSTGNIGSATRGGQGGSSVFNGITAYGGGGGGDWAGNTGGGGSTVGSAGGGTSNIGTQALSSSGQGNHGGVPGNNTTPSSFSYSGASGGGGAGSVGGPGIVYDAGNRGWEGLGFAGYKWGWTAGSTRYGYGGDGLAFDISGSVQFYGGGGGATSDGSEYWGIGGKGGGGNGGGRSDCNATYYGGGGGGGGAGGYTSNSGNQGGSGYQGVVIIAYNAKAGDLRYNSTTAMPEQLAGTWNPIGKMVTSSGGTATTSGGYTIRTFTGPGTFTLNTPGTVEALVVAGGGGGCDISGGGGAGGYIYQSGKRMAAGVYPVTIGTGGNGSTNWYNGTGTAGNPSVFADIEAVGGGAGAHYTAPGDTFAFPGTRSNGGSGGGGPGGHWDTNYGGVHGNPGNSRGQVSVNKAGDGIAGQGHPGGTGTHGHGWGFPAQPNGLCYAGGGGGGAGSVGGSIKDVDAVTSGGRGLATSITGSTQHYAGGGGGGIHQPGGFQHYGRAYAPGGIGGGGQAGGPGTSGTAGSANTGGGGGGGHHSGPDIAGPGGSGVVIVRHL